MHGWYLFHPHLPIFPVPVVQGVPAALTGASGSPLENPLITTGASPAGVAQVATLPATSPAAVMMSSLLPVFAFGAIGFLNGILIRCV